MKRKPHLIYAKRDGRLVIHWPKTLAKLAKAKREGFKYYWNMYLNARDAAGNWPLCACGSLCRNIPRNHDNSPIDGTLLIHGGRFFSAVYTERFILAEEAMERIETRAAEILTVSGKKLKPYVT